VRKRLKVKLAYNTVLSILRTLETKGYVGHEEEGRAHRYVARVALCVPAFNTFADVTCEFRNHG
jgi:predicted transcriptional regulator